jgi:hypothetical protein
MSEVSKLQQQITQTLAESFNLMQQASFDGLKGAQIGQVSTVMTSFQAVIQGLAEGTLVISEAEEAEFVEPGLARIMCGEDSNEAE